MAGDWIPIQTDLSRRREVLSISRETGRSRFEVVGLLIEFWGWASGETDVDAIVDVYVDTLPSLVGGDTEFWTAVMRAGWLESTDTGICIPNFDRWMSKGAKSRLRKNLRQKKWRGEQSESGQNVDASVDTQPSTTEQNRTEYIKKPPNPLRGNCGGDKSKRKSRRRKRKAHADRRPAVEAWAIAVKLAKYQSQYAQHDPERWKLKQEQCPADVLKFAEDFGLKSIREGKVEIVRGQFVKLWNDSS